MGVNIASATIAREHGYNYHVVRIAINRLVNVGGLRRSSAEELVETWATESADLDAKVWHELEAIEALEDV